MKNKIAHRIIGSVLLLAAITGVCCIAYPFVGMFINNYIANQSIVQYNDKIEKTNSESLEKQKEKAENFNKNLNNIVVEDPINNKKQKEPSLKTEYKDGDMEGYIVIPDIDVSLPIYEGTKEDVLSKGVGHLINTSLPFGGKGTHSVLTGHTGLTNAKYFDDLDKLEKGNVFYIKFLDKTIEYKIDNTYIIKPLEVDKYIAIDNNKDLCTLITCTPRIINSHRLLVQGHRIPYDKKDKDIVKNKIERQKQTISYAIALLFIIPAVIIAIVIIRKIRRKRKNGKDQTKKT